MNIPSGGGEAEFCNAIMKGARWNLEYSFHFRLEIVNLFKCWILRNEVTDILDQICRPQRGRRRVTRNSFLFQKARRRPQLL